MICAQILTFEDKSTMNSFAINSLNKVREDKLGPAYDKHKKSRSPQRSQSHPSKPKPGSPGPR
jgi:hypothetical protein